MATQNRSQLVSRATLLATDRCVIYPNGSDVGEDAPAFKLPSYTVATLPAGSAGLLIYVSDGTANKRLAVHDGTSWRFPDGAVVS